MHLTWGLEQPFGQLRLAESLAKYARLMRATGRGAEAETLEARAKSIRDRNAK